MEQTDGDGQTDRRLKPPPRQNRIKTYFRSDWIFDANNSNTRQLGYNVVLIFPVWFGAISIYTSGLSSVSVTDSYPNDAYAFASEYERCVDIRTTLMAGKSKDGFSGYS